MSHRPTRVLHIVRAMNPAGIENWLMNVLRRIDRDRVQMDFLVHSDTAGVYDVEITDRGAALLRCTKPLWSPEYGLEVVRAFTRCGAYDVVHSHVHHFSGYILMLARLAGVRSRIAHSHSDTSSLDRNCSTARRGYLSLMRRLVQGNATRLVAASARAALALFGPRWASDPRTLVFHCGIDLRPFRQLSRASARAQWKIGESELVVGHLGRFDTPKNHLFLIEIFREILRNHPNARLLLVGDGPLRPSIEAKVRQCGISERIIFAGMCEDVVDLLSAIDVSVFPSLHEGLPLSVIEAQATGLSCVLSDTITEEADALPRLIHRMSLSEPPARWAAEAIAAARTCRSAPESLSTIAASSFNIENSMDQLYALYNA